MPLIKHDRLAEDPWVALADDAPLPAGRPVIVSLARWRSDTEALGRHDGLLGVRLKSDEPAQEIADDLEHLDLIALDFPSFRDGRAYTTARLLRERYRFAGELRATGDVQRDQALFLRRCGFDAFEVRASESVEAWQKALEAISVRFQAAGDRDGVVTALRGRHPAAPSTGSACAAYWAY